MNSQIVVMLEEERANDSESLLLSIVTSFETSYKLNALRCSSSGSMYSIIRYNSK